MHAPRLFALAAFILASLFVASAAAQTAPAPLDRLIAVHTATSLYQDDLKPWYLKLELQLNDTDGKPVDKATVEEWWASEKLDKRVYTTSGFKATYLRKDDHTYHSEGYEYPGFFLAQLSNDVVRPVPLFKSDVNAKSNKEDFGTVTLDCVEVDRPANPASSPSSASAHPKLATRYCVSPADDVLRAILGADHIDLLRNTLGKFQNRQVAVDVSARAGDITRATAHIATLSSKPIPPDVFSTAGLVEQSTEPSAISGGLMAGKTLNKQEPVYPVFAKQRHIQGTVYLHAFIGKEGHVHSLEVLSSPSTLLNAAALDAVQHWTYQPYLLNGNPTDVETTIEVNFYSTAHRDLCIRLPLPTQEARHPERRRPLYLLPFLHPYSPSF